MEMCPYCGEEVPADSPKCWKCGTELSESAAKAPSDELEVPDDEPEEGGEPGGPGPMIQCPHCEAPVPKKASRCRDCGRPVREVKANHAAAAWRLGTWLVVGGVAIVAAIGVTTVSLRRRHAAEVRTPLPVKFEELQKRLLPLQAGNAERKRDLFTRDLEGKWVLWKAFVISADPDTLHVKVGQVKGGKAECDIEFQSEMRDEVRDLKPDQEIVYSARLVDFGKDGLSFTLGEGRLEK